MITFCWFVSGYLLLLWAQAADRDDQCQEIEDKIKQRYRNK
jgi:hypothetical protein